MYSIDKIGLFESAIKKNITGIFQCTARDNWTHVQIFNHDRHKKLKSDMS